MSETAYYDREELTRPGHVPALIGGPGQAQTSCTCGWATGWSSMHAVVKAVREHIDRIDTEPCRRDDDGFCSWMHCPRLTYAPAKPCDLTASAARADRTPDGRASIDVTPDAYLAAAVIGLPMRLRAHRAAHDVSLREVAKRTGVAASTLMRIEHGEDYTVDSLLAVAVYLDGAR